LGLGHHHTEGVSSEELLKQGGEKEGRVNYHYIRHFIHNGNVHKNSRGSIASVRYYHVISNFQFSRFQDFKMCHLEAYFREHFEV